MLRWMPGATRRQLATYADLAKLGDSVRAEIIGGTIVEKASPKMEHASVQLALAGHLGRRFVRQPGGRWPGGWWIGTEVDVEYGPHELFCHDIAGWRRDRVTDRPTGRPVRIRPDWVGEILSPSNEKRDLVDKMRVLHASGVPHYWILKPEEKILVVHRHEAAGYLVALTSASGETVRAEPFAAVELRVGVLFGDDEEDE
jgi:Uma2 family endonuclease